MMKCWILLKTQDNAILNANEEKKTILTSSHQRVVSFGYGKVPNEWRRMHLPAHSTKLKSSKYSLCWLFILTVQMSSLAIRFGVGSVFPIGWRSKLSSWKFWLIKSNKFISIANGCIFIVFVPWMIILDWKWEGKVRQVKKERQGF